MIRPAVEASHPPTQTRRICMHSPSAQGGQPLYVQELLTALSRRTQGRTRFDWVAAEDIETPFQSNFYTLHRALPRLPHRREFRTKAGWAFNRATHYARSDQAFLQWLARRPDIGLVHFQEFSRSLPSLLRRVRTTGPRIVYTVHNIRPHAYPPFYPRSLWDERQRQACRLCDRLIVHTQSLRQELIEFLQARHPPIDVAPHGVWTRNDPFEIPPIAQRMASKRLLFFGTIRRNKGLDVLLQAVPLLRGFHLTIAGAAREAGYFHDEVLPKINDLRREGASIDVIDRFIPDEEVGRLFADHAVLLLPYTKEFTAQSGVIFLALTHETPVVASEVGGLRDVFDTFDLGAIFREPTAEALAAATRTLLAQKDWEPLATRLRVAKERFSWNAAAAATLATYNAALNAELETDDRAVAPIPA